MNKPFVVGFVSRLLLFIVINLLAAHLASNCGLATYSPGNSCAVGVMLDTVGGQLFSRQKKPLPK